MLREKVAAGGEFWLSRTAGEDLLVGGGDESDFVCGDIGGEFLGKPLGKGAAAVIGEFAVGEREGLLGDDGLAASIALGWVRRVEQLGKLALAVWLGKALEIETAVAGFLLSCVPRLWFRQCNQKRTPLSIIHQAKTRRRAAIRSAFAWFAYFAVPLSQQSLSFLPFM